MVTGPMTSRDPKGAVGSTVGYPSDAWLLVHRWDSDLFQENSLHTVVAGCLQWLTMT